MLPPGENIIETKKCRLSGQEFAITDKDLLFYDKVSPIFGGKKYPIPSPTLCPEERMRRRLCFCNNRVLHFDDHGELSRFHDNGYTSLSPKEYWSDRWSAFDYKQKFDPEKSIFPQFDFLNKLVPKLSRSVNFNHNSDYVNHAGELKYCYWVFEGDHAEKLYYGQKFLHCKDCVDFLAILQCEGCYSVVDCEKCYNVSFSQEAYNCRDSSFLFACRDCVHCFGCINLISKEYCFMNQQLTKEEYNNRMREFNMEQHRSLFLERLKQFFQTQIYRENNNIDAAECTGMNISHSNKVFDSFSIFETRDAKYCQNIVGPADHLMDIYRFGSGLSYSYEGAVVGLGASQCLFCVDSWENISNLIYCMFCNKGVNNCFLSTGLSKANHCILNCPYSTEEYESLCGRIIDHMKSTGEWGEFFPHELSPFGYNQTVAHEYFPMTEIDVKEKGWNWSHAPEKSFEGTAVVPLSISEYDEKKVGYDTAQKNIDILLAGVMLCGITHKPFKILRQELAFYIEHGFPIPTKHPDQRHRERLALRNPRIFYERNCSECHKSITTTYSPDRLEKIVCEECYRKLVY